MERPTNVSIHDIFDIMERIDTHSNNIDRLLQKKDRDDKFKLLETLPRIQEDDLDHLGHRQSQCSICIQPFLAILSEEETAIAMDSPAVWSGNLGVTRLQRCGHLFCRRDISEWIRDNKTTCPLCREGLYEPRTNVQESNTQQNNEEESAELVRELEQVVFGSRSDEPDHHSLMFS